MSLDSDTIKIYEELKIAARDGDLLSYANKLARSMMGERVSVETGARETISNPDLIRPPTPQPRSMEQQTAWLDNSLVGRQIPAPVRATVQREEMDRVRVSNL